MPAHSALTACGRPSRLPCFLAHAILARRRSAIMPAQIAPIKRECFSIKSPTGDVPDVSTTVRSRIAGHAPPPQLLHRRRHVRG